MGCCLSTTADDDSVHADLHGAEGAGGGGRRRRQQQTEVDFGRAVRWTAEQPMTEQALQRQRDEFWETAAAYEGQGEIWQALRLACESDDRQLALAIVDSVGVTVPTGRLTDGAYDERGARYIVPQYCLSAPDNLVAADECASSRSSGRLSAATSNRAPGGQGVKTRPSLDSTQSVGIRTAVLHSPAPPGAAAPSSSHAATGALPPLLYRPASIGSSDAGSLVSLPNSGGGSGGADVRIVRIRLSSGADAEARLAPDTTVAQLEAQLRAGGYIPAAVHRVRFLHLGRLLAPQQVPARDLRLTQTAVIQAMYSTP